MLSKHSVTIRGHRTSFSLEDPFWQELRAIARAGNISASQLVTEIDAAREPGQNLSSAIRLHVLKQLKKNPPGSDTTAD